MVPIILLGLAFLTCAVIRALLPGWNQKGGLFGLVAIVLAALILLNPEFLSLGLIGDAAFFDTLVLLISFRLQSAATQAWTFARPLISKARRRLGFPSPGLSYLAMISALLVGSVISALQKALHRFSA